MHNSGYGDRAPGNRGGGGEGGNAGGAGGRGRRSQGKGGAAQHLLGRASGRRFVDEEEQSGSGWGSDASSASGAGGDEVSAEEVDPFAGVFEPALSPAKAAAAQELSAAFAVYDAQHLHAGRVSQVMAASTRGCLYA